MGSEMPVYQTIKTKLESDVGTIQIYRPEANNTINDKLILECIEVLSQWDKQAKIVILEGLPDVFCFGADFSAISEAADAKNSPTQNSEPLYQLWQNLSEGPYISIAKLKGQVNAGGVGFVAACDIVLSEKKVMLSLSELLFSMMPACVMPFLIRKIGFQKAHYMTLMTQPISASKALEMGLIDALEENVDDLLRKHLLRLRRLNKKGITRYKNYMNLLNPIAKENKQNAINANLEVFSDIESLAKIARYVKTGKLPWEEDE
tara:strand:+ start:60950 stop:61735 length:786 start_codon:yes stop_codon:yes gene_type:complete